MKRISGRMIVGNLRLVCVLTLVAVLGAGCSQNPSKGFPKLSIGNPVTKAITNQNVDSYEVYLEKGTYVGLSVEQRDVDVITGVFGPDEQSIGEFDTPTSNRGTEEIRFAADTPGNYRVDIYTLSEMAEPGEYELEITAFRPITERDKKILAAVRFHQEADRLRGDAETRNQSIAVYDKALQIWRELGESPDEANTLRAMGFAYQRSEDLEKAKEHFGKALEIWDRIGDVRSAAFTHVIFGVISKKLDDPQGGLEHDLMAQPLWEKAGDMPEYTQNLVRLGKDYIKLRNNAEALAYFRKAIDQGERIGRKSLRAYVLSECGNAHAAIGNKGDALTYYRQSLELWRILGRDKTAADIEEKIAKLSAG